MHFFFFFFVIASITKEQTNKPVRVTTILSLLETSRSCVSKNAAFPPTATKGPALLSTVRPREKIYRPPPQRGSLFLASGQPAPFSVSSVQLYGAQCQRFIIISACGTTVVSGDGSFVSSTRLNADMRLYGDMETSALSVD